MSTDAAAALSTGPARPSRHLPDIDPQRCTGCRQCAWRCPFAAITMRPRTSGLQPSGSTVP